MSVKVNEVQPIQSEEVNESDAETATENTDDSPVRRPKRSESNPFDYPFVFSALLLAVGLWFGYDGWFNPKTESIMFNRVVFVGFMVCCVWTALTDWRLVRRRRERAEKLAMEQNAEPASNEEVVDDSKEL